MLSINNKWLLNSSQWLSAIKKQLEERQFKDLSNDIKHNSS